MEKKSFLQSKEWASFQESLGRRIFWLDGILLVEMPLRLGKSYLFAPRCAGKVFEPEFLRQLGELKEAKHIFFRAEPNLLKPADRELAEAGFRKLNFDLQPSRTIVLDLSKSEEALLTAMHPKTRYNIRLAEKHGVKIKKGEEYFDDFWRLLQATARRDRLKLFPKEHYRKQLITTDDFHSEIWVAEYEKEIIAANLVNFYGETVIYLHGASSDKYRNVMAPQLLQWEQIKEGQARQFKNYDFWGFDEARWPGVSRFKKGFGGQVAEYAGVFDLVWQPVWYFLYNLARRVL